MSLNRADEFEKVQKLLAAGKYIIGIIERGEGRKIRDDESVEQFVLGYVKKLEAIAADRAASDGMTNEELRRAIRETQDQYMASANYREHLAIHVKELMAIEIERAKCGDN